MWLPSKQYCEFIWGQQSVHLSMAGLPRTARASLPTLLMPGSWRVRLTAAAAAGMEAWARVVFLLRCRSLSGRRRHNCPCSFHGCRSANPDLLPPQAHQLLLYCISVSLMLLPLILSLAIFDCKAGAEKPWPDAGESVLDMWPLETWDLLGYFRDCSIPEDQLWHKAIQFRHEPWTIPVTSSMSGKLQTKQHCRTVQLWGGERCFMCWNFIAAHYMCLWLYEIV